MRALVGAASAAVMILTFMFLVPPDRDSIFIALPWNLKVSCVLGWMALEGGAALAFCWAAFPAAAQPLSSDKREIP